MVHILIENILNVEEFTFKSDKVKNIFKDVKVPTIKEWKKIK